MASHYFFYSKVSSRHTYVDVILSSAGRFVLLNFVVLMVAERYVSLSHGAVDHGLM